MSRAAAFRHCSKFPQDPATRSTCRAHKEEVDIPVIAVSLITEPEQAETIVASRQADMVALARGMLYDPRWPWHAAAKLGAQIRAPRQYWRSQPRKHKALFGDIRIGQR